SSRRRHTRFKCDGVQTCALPISQDVPQLWHLVELRRAQPTAEARRLLRRPPHELSAEKRSESSLRTTLQRAELQHVKDSSAPPRSEERRVGKECRCRWRQRTPDK